MIHAFFNSVVFICVLFFVVCIYSFICLLACFAVSCVDLFVICHGSVLGLFVSLFCVIRLWFAALLYVGCLILFASFAFVACFWNLWLVCFCFVV